MDTEAPKALDVVMLFKPSAQVPFQFTREQTAQIKNAAGGGFWWFESEEELLESSVEADVLFTWGAFGPQPETYCAANKRLKWLHSFSAGMDTLMASEIAKLPIAISNSSGVNSATIAEHVMGFIVAFNRNFPFFLQKQREHIWCKGMTRQPVEAYGRTIGMIGAGSIATAVAKLAKAFEMRTIGLRRSVAQSRYFDEMVGPERMEYLLGESDYVLIATPYTPETRHIIGARELALMRPSALLINVARGGVLDHDALIEALEGGLIGGAALDVTDPEPLPPDSPLWDMENVMISPHMSADAPILAQWSVDLFCESLLNFREGRPIRNLMNK